MSEIGKKLNYPQTSQIPDEKTRVYARKLTRVLDDLKSNLLRSLKQYIDEQISNIDIQIGELDHGNLLGLQDIEDHLYAFLHDGSRAFTAYGPGFSNDPLLTDADPFSAVSEEAIKAYVDALLAYILASPVGTVIYIWDDDGTHYLERLEPGQYGQVLTTAGPNHRPFWAWVWEEPGADFGGRVFFRVWMYAEVEDVSIIDMDVETTVEPGGLTTILRDSESDPTYFAAYKEDPSFDAEVYTTSIITMDVTKMVTITMFSDESAAPSASPSVSPSVSPSLSPSVSPSASPPP